MVRKKLDARIRTLIERSVVTGQRSMLVLVGDHGKDQVPNLHQLLARTSVKARPKVLWCYKKELGFSTHRMKVRVVVTGLVQRWCRHVHVCVCVPAEQEWQLQSMQST